MLASFDLVLLGKALLAAVLGFAIGWEHENSGASAGDRTFTLVGLACAVLTAFSREAFPENADRLIAGAATGVGFLGAGLILRHGTGETRGPTTAAGLRATAALGVLEGAGHALAAILLNGLVPVILVWEDIPLSIGHRMLGSGRAVRAPTRPTSGPGVASSDTPHHDWGGLVCAKRVHPDHLVRPLPPG